MPLGDSITVGLGSSDNEAGYRNFLYRKLLNTGFYPITFGSSRDKSESLPSGQKLHEGHSGWTIQDLTYGVTPRNEGGLGFLENIREMDYILLMIGTNNLLQGKPYSRQDLEKLIDLITEQIPDSVLIVSTIIPINSMLEKSNEYNRSLAELVTQKIADGYNLLLLDMNTGFPVPYSEIIPDNVHPVDRGYQWIADQWFYEIMKIEDPMHRL